MRDLLTGIAILVILVLTAAFAAPWFVDWNAWRGEAEKHLGAMMARNVRIAGDMSVRFLPQPRLTLSGLAIDAVQAPASLTADHVSVELSLTSLLRGELRITEGAIDHPVIRWRDSSVPPTIDATAAPTPSMVIERLTVRGGELQRLAPDGTVQFEARGDLTLEAAALAGPWKAQGRVQLAGRQYDIRWASGAMDGEGHGALKISLQDANLAFIAEADGALIIDRKAWRAPPRFDGRVTASGTLPWPFGKAGEQPWRVVANGSGEVGSFTARELELSAGPQDADIKADGEGILFYNDSARARLALALRPVDLDKIAMEPGQQPTQWAFDNAAAIERLLAAIPFPIALSLDAERAFARGESFGPVKIISRLEPGRIVVERAEAQGPGALKANASGEIWIDAAPALDAAITVSSGAPSKAWAWLSGTSADATATSRFARATDFSASGRVRWRAMGVSFDDIAVALDGARANVTMQRRFPTADERGRINLNLRADKLDLDLVPPLGSFTGTERPDMAVSVSAREVVSGALGGGAIGALDIEARHDAGVLTVSRFAVRKDGLSFTADGVVKNNEGRFATELIAEDLRPLAALLQRAFPGVATDALAARASALSPARLYGVIGPTPNRQLWTARLDGVAGDTRVAAALDARPQPELGALAFAAERLRLDVQATDAGRLVRQLGWDAAASSNQPGSVVLEVIATPGAAASNFTLAATLAGAYLEASSGAGATARDFSGVARLNAADIGPLLRILKASGLASAAPQPASLEGRIAPGLGGLYLTELRGRLGAKTVKTSALQLVTAQAPKLTGRLDLSDLSLAEIAIPALGVDPQPQAGQLWSSARFPAFSSWPIDFDIELRAPRLALGGSWVATDAAVRLASRTDGLRIESATGAFAGGQLGLNGTIRRDGGLAAISGRLDATNLDLVALGATGATGRIDLSIDLAGSGEAVSRIIANLGGAGSTTLRGFTIPRLDAGASARTISALGKREPQPSFAATLALIDQELSRAPLVITTASAPVTMAAGVARVGPARVTSPSAFLAGSAMVDIRNFSIDARGSLGETPAAGPAAPEIGVAFAGPLASPRRTIDAGLLFNDLTQKAVTREAQRIETIEQDARERASFNRRLRAERDRIEAERRASRPPEPAQTGSTPFASPPTRPPLNLQPPQGQ